MAKPTTVESEVARFRRDIDQVLRERIRETIQVVLEEELSDALGCHRHDRTSTRAGYRNGSIEREITTETGNQRLRIPRGRLDRNDGTTEEFRSEILPRYARRTRRVDDAILGVYLAGGNTRRIRKAMAPLLGEENLSRSAISRVGQSTRPRTPRPRRSRSTSGRAKAAVLPEPVCASPTMSRPARASGIT